MPSSAIISCALISFIAAFSAVNATRALASEMEPEKHTEEIDTGQYAPDKFRNTDTKLIPLPIYATDPSEGSTFGLMPVFLQVNKETGHTVSIWAPSASWNRVIGESGTFRWYHYPNDHQSLTITGGASTHVNYGGLLIWNDDYKRKDTTADTVFFRWGRNIFYRFFGLGPNTQESAESSHTRIKADLWYRKGYYLTPDLNLGARLEFSRDTIEAITVPGYPASPNVFAGAPGMGGSTVVSESIDLRYDTRDSGDYANHGLYLDFAVGPAQGLASSPDYWTGTFQAKELFEETDGLQGAARFFTSYVSDPTAPFYHQSSLGGSFLMRGLIDDRFIDQGAWTAEFEQRIRLFQLHIYGVTSEWRVDPFVAIGQVYGEDSGPFTHVQSTGGLGFRAWVKPNVLGRVDVAYSAAEQLQIYVELGYPF